MAFGGRELRLILSIQSYGTTNIQRLRRDILQLGSATDIANKKAMASARMLGTQARMKQLDRELVGIQAGNAYFQQRHRLVGNLVGNYSRLYSQQAKIHSLEADSHNLNARRLGLQMKQDKLRGSPAEKIDQRQLQQVEEQLKAVDAQERSIASSGKAVRSSMSSTKANIANLEKEYKALIAAEQVDTVAVEKNRAAHAAASATYKMQEEQLQALTRAEKMQALAQQEVRARAVAHAGRTAQFAGLIGIAGTSLAATSFANFNKQASLAATQMRGVNETFASIPQYTNILSHGLDQGGKHFEGILELMKQFPATGDEMAQSAYDIYSSMDVTTKGGLRLLKLFNQLAVATGTDLPTATNAGITVMNDFGGTTKNAAQQINLMMAIIRFGRMRLADLNTMLNKVAPGALAAGQSLRDVAGAMVLITRVQPSQRIGATGIARLLQTFRDPDFQKGIFNVSKGMVDITRGKGAVGALKPLPDIINMMAHATGLYMKYGGPQQLFKSLTALGRGSGIGRQSRIEAANAFTFLIKYNEEYQRLQKRTTTDTNEFASSLKAMSNAPGVQWQVFINGMRALGITFGEDILPSLMVFVGWLSKAATWFENLSASTKKLIGNFIVWGSVSALVIGTIVNIAGSFVALVANMRIARGAMEATGAEAEATAAKVNVLGASMKVLMGVGLISIPIIVQFLKGGDPGVFELLMAAAMGAAGGAQIGSIFGMPLAGAAVGALTLPVIVEFIASTQKNKNEVLDAYSKYKKQVGNDMPWWKKAALGMLAPLGAGGTSNIKGSHVYVDSQVKPFKVWLKEHPKYLKMWQDQSKKHGTNINKIMADYNRNVVIQNKKSLQEIRDYTNQINKAYEQQNNNQSTAQQKSIAMAKAHANAMQQAMTNQKNTVKQAVDNLSQIYDTLHQQNESAFGALGQGSVMQGIFGSVFTGLNDLLRQFGVQIPIPFSIIKKDFDQQLVYFKRWQGDLAKLRKKGLPEPLIEQLQQMGPTQGIPYAEGLLGASPKQIAAFKKQWKTAQDILDKQTQTDLNNKIKYWLQYGKNAAWALLNGFASSVQSAQLQNKFKNLVHTTFGSVLKAQFAKDVATYMDQAEQDWLAAHPKTTTGGGGGGGTPKTPTPSQTKQAASAVAQATKNATAAKQAWEQAHKAAVAYRKHIVLEASQGGTTITGAESRREKALTAAEGKALTAYNARRRDYIQARQRAVFTRAMNLPIGTERGLKAVGTTIQTLVALSKAAYSPGGKHITAAEAHAIAEARARRDFAAGERRAAKRQLSAARAAGQEKATITYGGDTIHITTGATVNDVIKALDRHRFRRRQKKHGTK